eukprot:CAMPEP_0202456298 /NCGR_PEP_ID=MMETSP1360-20130828/13592_1 /ASSEMBLY_ACC=CAM_ASM_000848 /TAXON_ID=515479 /ORGANISM="Licmophora paradoxa, Strain CCMP2313" /LENGTH=492 /DNA_ID=CAMNT_0049076063 /DNA_START=182 /DNA_END=1660 /DNA_ORIENTATION=-
MVIAPTEVDGEPNNVMRALMDLMKLSHSNVINVHEAYLHDDKCHWIMEDWTDGVSRGLGGLNEVEISDMIRRLVSAFRYMHNHGVIHGNLSVDEIHFFRTENLKLDFKIADLGMGRHVCPLAYAEINQHQRYGCPPEAKHGEFTQHGDVWTVGAVAHFILTGGLNKTRLADRKGCWKAELASMEHISDGGKDFIISCIKQNPEDRASLDDLLQHPWFGASTQPIIKDKQFFTNLQKCDPKNQFKRACLWKLVRLLSYDDLTHMRNLWFSLDINFSGSTDETEFVTALVDGAGISFDKAQEYFEYFDFHKTTLLDFCDFCSATMQFQGCIFSEEKIREAFYMLDFDGDGLITPGDLSKAVDIPYNRALQYMKRVLRQRHPAIGEEQFVRIMSGENLLDSFRRRSLQIAKRSSSMVDEKMRNLSAQMALRNGPMILNTFQKDTSYNNLDGKDATNNNGGGSSNRETTQVSKISTRMPAKHQNLRSWRTLTITSK